MTTNLISFTTEERRFLNFNIHQQDIDPSVLDSSVLPTDIHLVEYEVEGKLYVDAIRAYKMVDIFDGYYDKLKPLGGKLISITSGYGSIRPNLFIDVNKDK